MRAVNGNNHADMPANIAGQAGVPRLHPENRSNAIAGGKARLTRIGTVALLAVATSAALMGLWKVGTDCVLRPVASSSDVTSPEPKSIAA